MVYLTLNGDFESTRERKIKPLNFEQTDYSQFLGQSKDSEKRPRSISSKHKRESSTLWLQVYNIGILFGYQDVIQKRNYSHSVKCISQTGSLYSISAKEFHARFSKDDDTWRMIMEASRLWDQKVLNKV